MLKSAGVSEARLADEVGVTRMAMSRYVRGVRRPDSGTVRLTNDRATKLVGVPEARDYLFALAFYDGLLALESGDIPSAALRRLLRGFDAYFVTDASEAVEKAAKKARLGEQQILELFVDLAAVRGKHLLFRLDGAEPKEMSIDQVLWVFRTHGAPLEPHLRSDEEAKMRRIREFFGLWVEAVVTSRFAEIPVERRRPAIAAILEQFAEAIDDITTTISDSKAPQRKRPRRKVTPLKPKERVQ
jgi:transcriptional regulator with XRE-family HTH domain